MVVSNLLLKSMCFDAKKLEIHAKAYLFPQASGDICCDLNRCYFCKISLLAMFTSFAKKLNKWL